MLAVGAVDERIGEVGEVAGGLPHLRGPQDRGESISTTSWRRCTIVRIQASLTLRSMSEPSGPVVVRRAEAAVDLGGLVHEAASLTEADDLFEVARGHRDERLTARRGTGPRVCDRSRRRDVSGPRTWRPPSAGARCGTPARAWRARTPRGSPATPPRSSAWTSRPLEDVAHQSTSAPLADRLTPSA